jgi:hypothetical protein
MESRILAISICGKMKIHVQLFHNINSGSSSTYGPVFVVIINLDPGP